MSDGITHLRGTLALTPVAAGLGWVIGGNTSWVLWAAGGCLAGILLTPDLDQETISTVEWKVLRLTLGLGHLWLAFWGPYSAVMPHRSFLSHGPIISTSLRVLYMWAGFKLLGEVFLAVPDVPALRLLMLESWFQAAFLGLCLSDLGHWVLDRGVVSRALMGPKARRRRDRRRRHGGLDREVQNDDY